MQAHLPAPASLLALRKDLEFQWDFVAKAGPAHLHGALMQLLHPGIRLAKRSALRQVPDKWPGSGGYRITGASLPAGVRTSEAQRRQGA